MRKLAASTLAVLTLAGAVATASPASAERRYHRHRGGGGDEVAAAIIGGVAGLALGSALSSNNNRGRAYYGTGYAYDPRYDSYAGDYYGRPYGYAPYGYAPRGYGPGYGSRTCTRTEHYYDPYAGQDVRIRRSYAC